MVYLPDHRGNGKTLPFNPVLRDAVVEDRPKPKPGPDPRQIPLPYPDPFQVPRKPQEPKRRSRARGAKIRGLMTSTGMSRGYCGQLLTVLESNDFVTVGRVLNREITVHAAFLTVTGRSYDRYLAKQFNSAPVEVREQLIALID